MNDADITETAWQPVEFSDQTYYVTLEGFGLRVCQDPLFPRHSVRLTQDMIAWLASFGLKMIDDVPTEPGARHDR